jgi:hypothetical protein
MKMKKPYLKSYLMFPLEVYYKALEHCNRRTLMCCRWNIIILLSVKSLNVGEAVGAFLQWILYQERDHVYIRSHIEALYDSLLPGRVLKDAVEYFMSRPKELVNGLRHIHDDTGGVLVIHRDPSMHVLGICKGHGIGLRRMETRRLPSRSLATSRWAFGLNMKKDFILPVI